MAGAGMVAGGGYESHSRVHPDHRVPGRCWCAGGATEPPGSPQRTGRQLLARARRHRGAFPLSLSLSPLFKPLTAATSQLAHSCPRHAKHSRSWMLRSFRGVVKTAATAGWPGGRWTERTGRARVQLTKLLADGGVQFMGHLGECLGEGVQAAVAQLQNGQVRKAHTLTNRTGSIISFDGRWFPNGRGRKPNGAFHVSGSL